jgi:hypothetical protein
LRTLTMITACAIAAIAITGCDDDDGEIKINPVPTFAVTPAPTFPDPTSIPLTPKTGHIAGYTLDLPSDWVLQPPQIGEDAYNLMEGERILAQVAVLCEQPIVRDGVPWEPIDYVNADIVYIEQLRGQYDQPEFFVIKDTYPATSIRTVTTLQTLVVRQKSVHIATEKCHWSVRLRIFAPGDVASAYEALFDRVVQTFSET